MNNLVRIDLGCGHRKAEGYLGIDRFHIPEVNIVADLNNGIPLEDNSVDIMLCSHSLEHFDNIYFIMEEIYRVCKHKALIYVLSPYHMETINFANIYHKQVFNESTFRFFTSETTTHSIDKRDYYNPHAFVWGLGSSDNSELNINIHTISMEYFYFPDYIDLSEEEKRNARRSFQNVCDQIYYTLAVNKSGSPFTLNEAVELKILAVENEPDIINEVRNREINKDMGTSILLDIKKWNNRLEEKFNSKLNELKTSYDFRLQKILKELEETTLEKNSLASSVLELIKNKESPSFKFGIQKLFRKGHDIYNALVNNHHKFIDGLYFHNKSFKKTSILTVTNTIPYSEYFEYSLSGVGSKITYFLFSNLGANLFMELVQSGNIIQQTSFTVRHEGMHVWVLEREISGEVLIRFRIRDNFSIVRLLEISNRKRMVLSRQSLAAYITVI